MSFSFHRGHAGRRSSPQLLLIAVIPLLWACDTGVEPVPVGGVIIAPVESELTVGSSVQLSATVQSTTGSSMPGHPVTWSSTAASVAEVTTGGMVSALTPGNATISATSEGESASVTFTVAAGPCGQATAGSIFPGENRAGTVDATDCTLGYARAEGWSLHLPSATAIRITMSSTDFNPEVVLTDLQLNPVSWSYSHPGGAQLVGELPAGEYIVWATSYDDSQEGAYQLSASEVQFCSPASATTQLAAGDVRSGTLGSSDCVFMHEATADGFQLSVPTPTGLSIDLSSTAFHGLVVVTDADLNVLWWDADHEGDGHTQIRRRFPAGEYLVWISGLDPSSSGAYELSLAEVEIVLCPVVGDLEPGQAASGTLSGGDCEVDGGYSDPWLLSLAAETTVRLDLTSGQFDAFLIVEDEQGNVINWDDDSGGELNARLVHTFAAGEYRVVATSWAPGETGSYQLTAEIVDVNGPSAPMLDSPVSRLPWLKAERREIP